MTAVSDTRHTVESHHHRPTTRMPFVAGYEPATLSLSSRAVSGHGFTSGMDWGREWPLAPPRIRSSQAVRFISRHRCSLRTRAGQQEPARADGPAGRAVVIPGSPPVGCLNLSGENFCSLHRATGRVAGECEARAGPRRPSMFRSMEWGCKATCGRSDAPSGVDDHRGPPERRPYRPPGQLALMSGSPRAASVESQQAAGGVPAAVTACRLSHPRRPL